MPSSLLPIGFFRRLTVLRLVLAMLVVFVLVPTGRAAAADPNTTGAEPSTNNAQWRIRIYDAAIASGDMVTLGDIATLHGTPPPGVWERLVSRPLWAAPAEEGKPLQINRARLSRALKETLGDVADICLLPASLAIQKGGAILREEDLRALAVRELTPQIRNLPGHPELTDFRLPAYAFLAHAGQSVKVDPVKVEPGRLSLRFEVQEVDGSTVRRFSGTVMLDQWVEVPCAALPLNRGDSASPEQITWISKNMAHLRGDLWDGRGGPWQVQRAIGTGQPIYVADLAPLCVVRKGAIVTLVYAQGAVRLTAQAEALADGGPGSTIPVRNLQSKKQIYAVVRDSDTVEVK
ncbi:MAG: flagellar basal body P-ring formation chaperone FlgA [Bilophila sp.]